MLDNIRRTNNDGFTLAELVVAMTAGAIVVLVVLSITLFFFADIMSSNARATLLSDAQIALNRVVEDMRTGSEILINNTIPDANEPTGGWTTSNADLILIVSTPSIDSSNNFIFDSNTGNPFQDEFIYFTDGGKLYKRILANPSAPDNVATTTCPEASTTPTCPADKMLTENFENMTFDFYDQDNIPTTDPLLARSALINIYMQKDIFGRVIDVDNSIRMTLRNPKS